MQGSKSTYTPEKAEMFLKRLRGAGNVELAATSLGIHTATIKRWKRRPEFRAEYEKILAERKTA